MQILPVGHICFFIFHICKIDQSVILWKRKNFREHKQNRSITLQTVFLTNQWSSLAFGIGMVVVPLIYPFGLRIRRVHILSPTVLSTILVIGGILLLWFTLQSMRKAKALIAQGGTIKVEGNRVTYPSIEKWQGGISFIPHFRYRIY